jgi:hypothetical protein
MRMHEPDTKSPHIEDVILWAWQRAELEGAPALAVQEHLAACSSCRHRAGQILQMLDTLRVGHFAVQPSLAQQLHLTRALQSQTVPATGNGVWVTTSARLVRWLTPAVVALALLFLLTRESSPSAANDALEEFIAGMPEAALLSARTDEEMQSALLELMFSTDER